MRLKDRVAMVVGAGQAPGEGVGNGRATALTFAREGARVVCIDRDLDAAEATLALIVEQGGEGAALAGDVTDEASIRSFVEAATSLYGRIDVLHNNVGASIAAGDKPLADLDEAGFDNTIAVNLRGTVMTCKHVAPGMKERGSGSIINISSMAAMATDYPFVGYAAGKAGLVAFTKQLAIQLAPHGVRVNTILPGLMDTPMAVDTRVRATGRSRAEIVAERDSHVPLKGGMGTGWDVANAALFLASDEARFVTGVALPVDGGSSARVG